MRNMLELLADTKYGMRNEKLDSKYGRKKSLGAGSGSVMQRLRGRLEA